MYKAQKLRAVDVDDVNDATSAVNCMCKREAQLAITVDNSLVYRCVAGLCKFHQVGAITLRFCLSYHFPLLPKTHS
jgi:hypothetical protein